MGKINFISKIMIFILCMLAFSMIAFASEDSFAKNVEYTVYETDQQVIVEFRNNNEEVAFVSKTNVSFYDDEDTLLDSETMEALFVDAHSANYGEVTYYDEYSYIEVVPYIYDDDEEFDADDFFTITEESDEEVSELNITITNTGESDASAMITVVFYKNDEIFYVAPDVGETMLYKGDSEEVTVELPHDQSWEFLSYDSYEILIMGYTF